MYELVKYVHVLCAVTWVGGAIYAQLLAMRVTATGDPGDLPKLGRNIEWIGTRVFLPASILLFVAGVILTIQRWAFVQLWISIAIVFWLTSALLGSLYLGPSSKKVAGLFEVEGPSSPAAIALLKRLLLLSRLELGLFVVTIALMVFKPTIG
jgi:uncharacterized membrane protein